MEKPQVTKGGFNIKTRLKTAGFIVAYTTATVFLPQLFFFSIFCKLSDFNFAVISLQTIGEYNTIVENILTYVLIGKDQKYNTAHEELIKRIHNPYMSKLYLVGIHLSILTFHEASIQVHIIAIIVFSAFFKLFKYC